MALLEKDVEHCVVASYVNEMENLELYTRLLAIMHSMIDDDCYTMQALFNDLQNVTHDLRSRISETDLPTIPVMEGAVAVD